MGIVLTFVLNAGLNFALGLVVAAILGPEAFGRFSLAFTAAIVINTACFEWLRLCATRYYSERSRAEDAGLRATLDVAYAGVALTLAACVAIAAALEIDLGVPAALLAGATAVGLANAAFEYHAALARARFLDRVYAGLVIVKNALAFTLMAGGAWLSGDPAWVLAGAAVSAAAAVVPLWRILRDPGVRLSGFDGPRLAAMARYGVPIVAANVAYQVMMLMSRGAAASGFGYAEAGRLSLAVDLAVRLISAAGAALDVLLFQVAVRRHEAEGRPAAERQAMRNLVLVAALLVPLAAGYLALMPAFEALLVPAAFRGDFAVYSGILVPALLAYGLVQFALNPVFQLQDRTGPALAAAAAGLGVAGLGLLALPPLLGRLAYPWAHAAGLGAAFLTALVLALRATRERPSARDLALVAAATALMSAAVWPLRDLPPPLALAAGIGLGGALYAGVLLAFDAAGLRTLLADRLRARRGAPRPAE